MNKLITCLVVYIVVIVLFPVNSPASGSESLSTVKMNIKIGYAPFGMMETSVAKVKKFYKKYLPNVEIEWISGIYSIYLINKWIEGEIEISYLGDMPAIVLQNRVRNTKWVSAAVYPHGHIAAIYVPHNSSIKTIKELEGKTIATGIGSSHHRILEVFAEVENIEFKIVNLTPDEGIVALKEGRVDAVCYWPPYLEMIRYHDLGRALVPDFVKYEPEVNAVWPFIVSEQFAEKYPKVVEGLVRADQDLHAFMVQHPDEAAEIVYRELAEKIPLPVVKASLASYRYTNDLGKEQIETMQRGVDFLQSKGVIRKSFSSADWADSSFGK